MQTHIHDLADMGAAHEAPENERAIGRWYLARERLNPGMEQLVALLTKTLKRRDDVRMLSNDWYLTVDIDEVNPDEILGKWSTRVIVGKAKHQHWLSLMLSVDSLNAELQLLTSYDTQSLAAFPEGGIEDAPPIHMNAFQLERRLEQALALMFAGYDSELEIPAA